MSSLKSKYFIPVQSFTQALCWNMSSATDLAYLGICEDSKEQRTRMRKKHDIQEGLSQLSYVSHPDPQRRRVSRNSNPSSNHNPYTSQHLQPTTLTEVVLKALKGITYKRQRHLGRLLLLRRRGGFEPAIDLHRVGGLLLQVLGGEVGGVDLGR